MKTETTINLKYSIFFTLNTFAKRNKMSVSETISIILSKIIINEYLSICINRGVKYQERDPDKKWKCQHLSLSTEDYEILNDIRKFSKKSVSFIVSDAIQKYLTDTNLELEKINLPDNYLTIGYYICSILKNKRHKIKIVWGKPGIEQVSQQTG